jgi:hypothetical protein
MEAAIEIGFSYIAKDEVWITLCDSKTAIVVIEEAEQKVICRKHTQETQERIPEVADVRPNRTRTPVGSFVNREVILWSEDLRR